MGRIDPNHNMQGIILVVGSGYGEYLLEILDELKLGQKNLVRSHLLYGGSGVNYTQRLLHAGFCVFPILAIGDDNLGYKIRDEILASARKVNLLKSIQAMVNSDEFFTVGTNTQSSIILIQKKQRTSLTELAQDVENFYVRLKYTVEDVLSDKLSQIQAVIIGHIHADNEEINLKTAGSCTKYLVDKFCGNRFIFANFGDSQLNLGYSYWQDYLRKISLFQLNFCEAKNFFSTSSEFTSLIDIIEWLKDNKITTVITLDRYGAICNYRDGRDGLIYVKPIELENIVDTTGAGDAFGAALVAKLYQNINFGFQEFIDAVKEGVIWAAYACKHLGGAANCPERDQLKEFREKLFVAEDNPIEVLDGIAAEKLLKDLETTHSL
jgi:sugar/nucleoside kinase (ribokinase family)